MNATKPRERSPLPEPARLGFDDGWLMLPPTFLNLRMPVIVVDGAYIGEPAPFGLDQFGQLCPSARLPMSQLTAELFGDLILLRQSPVGTVIAHKQLSCRPAARLWEYRTGVLVVGNTYELQCTWAALWSMFIGTVVIRELLSTARPGLAGRSQGPSHSI